ncbi:MAG: OmpA family protein [Kineosporiaceae bacterium]|nr:OmpA family protein [Kineosporiaceae bacterium]
MRPKTLTATALLTLGVLTLSACGDTVVQAPTGPTSGGVAASGPDGAVSADASGAAAVGSDGAAVAGGDGEASASGSSGEPAEADAIGPDGAGADRFELLDRTTGGIVYDGTTLTLVYRNGIRYEIPVTPGADVIGNRDPVADLKAGQDVSLTSASGVLSVSPDGTADHTGPNGVTHRSADGSGTIIDPKGVITIEPDGTTQCVGADGVQQVNANGTKSSIGHNGVLAVDAKGRAVTAIGPNALAGAKPTGTFSVCGVGGTVTLELSGDVLFDCDSDQLTPKAKAVLAQAAALVRGAPKGPVQVIGHTDSKGSDAYNLDLSQRRATRVSAELTRLAGSGHPVTPTGAGERQPIAPNTTASGADDPVGRAKNRRVTIIFGR